MRYEYSIYRNEWCGWQLWRGQAGADIAPGFVGIPQVEWDAVFAANVQADRPAKAGERGEL